MKPILIIMCCGLTTLVAAMEVHEALPPEPLRQPLVPQRSVVQQQDERMNLLDLLALRVRQNEQQIRQLLRQYDGDAPPIQVSNRTELTAAVAARSEAWRLLVKALQERQQTIVPQRPDQLDKPGAQAGDAELRRLRAENELAVARCFQEMAQQSGSDIDLLRRGREVADQLMIADLAEAERVIAYFLRIWFTVELARLTPMNDERSVLIADAQERYRNFQLNHPESPLVENAEWLITMIDLDASISERKAAP